MRKIRKIFIASGHLYAAIGRKTSIHFFVDEFVRAGAEVCFLSVGGSLINRWRAEKGLYDSVPLDRWYDVRQGLSAFVFTEPFHPVNLRGTIPNVLSAFVYRVTRKQLPVQVVAEVKDCDLIVIESGLAILLAAQLLNANAAALSVYKANDLLRSIGSHPMLSKEERILAPRFDLIASASTQIGDLFPEGSKVATVSHGIDKEAFDAQTVSPYARGTRNVVSVGSTLFDPWPIETLARSHPEWAFHVFGARFRGRSRLRNVILHGERPFSETIPFIKFADIGLAPYKVEPSEAYLAVTSLKMLQYAYCGLPVLAPEGPHWGRKNIVTYRQNSPESMSLAFDAAGKMPRVPSTNIPTWKDAMRLMLLKLGADI
jgi:2-beta-glucuronyltransferase